MRTKVCITTNEYWPIVGGVGVSVDRITEMLCDKYEVHIVFFDFEGVTAELNRPSLSQKPPSIDTTELADGRVLHRVVPDKGILVQNPTQIYQQFYSQLFQLQEQYSFSLFHSFYVSSTGFLTGLVAKQWKAPVIASIRGNDIHSHMFSQRLSQIKWTLQNAQIITSVSKELMEIANIITPCADRAIVIYNSIDPNRFEVGELPAELTNLRKPVIGTAGVFKRKKGVDYLLDACSRLKRETDFTLLLVGYPPTSEQVCWDSLITDASRNLNVYVTGKVPHARILQYLAAMDIFVISSTNDGFPNTLLEAMVTGLPIISTKTAAMQEVLEDEKDSLLVQARSSECSILSIKRGNHGAAQESPRCRTCAA